MEHTPYIHKGTIRGFSGSWGSGLASVVIENSNGFAVMVPVENGAFVRAAEDAFGNVIAPGHTVNVDALAGQEIFYWFDELGMLMSGFLPVAEADEEFEEQYRSQPTEDDMLGLE